MKRYSLEMQRDDEGDVPVKIHNKQIKTYRVAPAGFNPVVFTDFERAIQEVRDLTHYGEVGDDCVIEIGEMTQKEFDDLPEHQGY